MAARAGVVVWAGPNSHAWPGRGNYVTLDHGGGLQSFYMHLSYVGVLEGQTVTAGEFLGFSGNTGWSTGPHLHFDVRENGVPIDPWPMLA